MGKKYLSFKSYPSEKSDSTEQTVKVQTVSEHWPKLRTDIFHFCHGWELERMRFAKDIERKCMKSEIRICPRTSCVTVSGEEKEPVSLLLLKLCTNESELSGRGKCSSLLLVCQQCTWVSCPRYKETIDGALPPLYHALFCDCSYALDKFGASKHKSPLFQSLEHCPVSCRLEKGQRWWQHDLGV